MLRGPASRQDIMTAVSPRPRRQALTRIAHHSAGVLGLALTASARVQAQPASIHDHLPWIPKMREDLGEARPVRQERVLIEVSPLVDNGNVVPLAIQVQSAMQGEDRVKSLRLYSEKNPQPRVATFHFSDYAPQARVATRIRLNGGQKLVAIAEMQDGRLFAGVAEVVVTISACIDGT